jgi:hypothetical protein
MTKKKTEAEKVKKMMEPEFVYSTTLTVVQIFKQGVRLAVHPINDGLPHSLVLVEQSLNFNRFLLPPDYSLSEGREYELTIKRVK